MSPVWEGSTAVTVRRSLVPAGVQGAPGQLRFSRREAEVILACVDVTVETQELGVFAQEAAPVGACREQVEAFPLEGFEVAGADSRRRLDVCQRKTAAAARLPQTVADLE